MGEGRGGEGRGARHGLRPPRDKLWIPPLSVRRRKSSALSPLPSPSPAAVYGGLIKMPDGVGRRRGCVCWRRRGIPYQSQRRRRRGGRRISWLTGDRRSVLLDAGDLTVVSLDPDGDRTSRYFAVAGENGVNVDLRSPITLQNLQRANCEMICI